MKWVFAGVACVLVAGCGASAPSPKSGPVTYPQTSPRTAIVPRPRDRMTNCARTTGSDQIDAATLDRCGYPSPTTTGVRAGTTLTPVASAHLPTGASWSRGTLTISGDDLTLSGVFVNGTVSITGSNDALKNSKVVAGGGQDLVLVSGTRNTIEDTEIEGIDSTTNQNFCGRAIHMSGSAWVRVTRVQIKNCADGIVGISHTTDSYILTNVTYCAPGQTGTACSHDEPIYLPGGNGSAQERIERNTLLNEQEQVAGIFGDDHAFGPLSNVTIDHNLIADRADNGAIAIGRAGDGNRNIVVTNNRLSYVYNAHMPTGTGNPAATVWKNNFRDDTLEPVPLTIG